MSLLFIEYCSKAILTRFNYFSIEKCGSCYICFKMKEPVSSFSIKPVFLISSLLCLSFYRLRWLMLFAVLMLFIPFHSIAYIKYSNVKIYLPKDQKERLNLLALLEVDHFQENGGAFMYTVDEDQLALLKKNAYLYEVINDDAVADLEKRNQEYYDRQKSGNTGGRVAFEKSGTYLDQVIPTPSAFVVQPTLGGYYRFGQMDTAMTNLVNSYPAIAKKFSIGTSVEGRQLWCIKISDNVNSDEATEPEVLFMGLHHAREAIGGSSMIFFMQYLCENYSTDSRIKDLVDNRQIYIIPNSNPDGWEYNRTTNPTGGGQWRKNRRNNGSGQYGVDLNRNWGVDWANCTGAIGASNCGSSIISSQVFWGTSAYSEPETKSLRTFVRSRKFVACMDQHSVGPYYSLPWGRIFNTMAPADGAVYTQMASLMGKYNGMRYGNTYETLGYEVSGGMKDLLLRGNDSLPNGKCYGMTGEGSNGTSSTSFWPLASEIVTLCKGMIYQNIQLLYMAGSYVDLKDIGTLNIQKTSGKLYFKARRIGLASQSVTVSVIPLQNISSVGSAVTIASGSLASFNGTYNDSIAYVLPPSITDGSIIQYVWRVQTGGYSYDDTITAMYKGLELFYDNMEGSLASDNWTITGGWGYTNDNAYTGTKSLSESPGVNYTPDSRLIAQLKSNINLSGADVAFLSFWVKYRAENYRDILRVEASTDGTIWSAISGTSTVREPGTADGSVINDSSALTGINEFWSREVFNLSKYTGALNLRLRFRFTSDTTTAYLYSNDAGFNIDDLTIYAGSFGSLLPIELLTFEGRNNGAFNDLYWTTASEKNTHHYVVEKSPDALTFQAIGSVAATPNNRTPREYSFTDLHPYGGENIYRLKVVYDDSTFEYSRLVLIKSNDAFSANNSGIKGVYPNPATDNTSVEIHVAEQKVDYNLNVYNTSGQRVHNRTLSLGQGEHTVDIDLSQYAQGTYFITLNKPQSGILYETKIIKN